jgi:eukaryotic-like serine/threonine-protein kinase
MTITEKLRYRVEKTVHTTADQQALQEQCKTIWDQRDLIAGLNREGLTEKVRATLIDFVVLWLETNNSGKGIKEDVKNLAILAEAEQLLGTSLLLEKQRRMAQGNGNDAESIEQTGSAWEKVIWGRSLLHAGEVQKAASLFQKAVDARPDDFWPNYYLGICSYKTQQYQEALRWFSVAVALAPESAECYYNRALTLLALDRQDEACHEYDKALEVRADFGAASLNRGHVYYLKKEYPRALADFEHALCHGADPVLAHYNLALCQLSLENSSEAVQHLRAVLELRPQHVDAQQLLKQLQQKPTARLK